MRYNDTIIYLSNEVPNIVSVYEPKGVLTPTLQPVCNWFAT